MNKRFVVLDAWRGIAASFVVLFHLHVYQSITESDVMRGAWLFVPFFFILSGFVLMHAYGKRPNFKAVPMMKKRVLRLWPLHLIMLFVFVIFETGKLLAQKAGMHFTYPAFEAMNAPSEILPNLFLSQSWFSQFNSLSFNYPSWSISVEFGMYLILATVLFAIRDIKCRTAAFAWLASLAAIVMILNIDGTRSLAHAGMFGFSLGIILHFFYTKTHDVVARLPAWFFTLAEIEALVVTYILLTFTLPVPYLTASLGFMAVIYVFTFEGGLFSKLLALKPFQSIGAWSYSIYMIHAAIIFILTIGTQITKHGSILSDTMNAGEHAVLRFFDTGNAVANQILPFLILILVWAISSQTYKYIEVPGQKAFSKK